MNKKPHIGLRRQKKFQKKLKYSSTLIYFPNPLRPILFLTPHALHSLYSFPSPHLVYKVKCIWHSDSKAMETTTDKKSTITLFDREYSQLQNMMSTITIIYVFSQAMYKVCIPLPKSAVVDVIHCFTAGYNGIIARKISLHSPSVISLNTWKSEDTKSGLYSGCGGSVQPKDSAHHFIQWGRCLQPVTWSDNLHTVTLRAAVSTPAHSGNTISCFSQCCTPGNCHLWLCIGSVDPGKPAACSFSYCVSICGTHLAQTFWYSNITTTTSNTLKPVFSSLHSSLIVICWFTQMIKTRCFMVQQLCMVMLEYGSSFTLLPSLWKVPLTPSLCSHSLFGLHQCSVSVNECQGHQFFCTEELNDTPLLP